jgi:hypothetical protein
MKPLSSRDVTIRRQRYIVGYVGVALPFALPVSTYLAGGWNKLDIPHGSPVFPGSSVSIYAYSPAASVFVALLSALGLVLISYRGNHFVDDMLGLVAGCGALGVALFKTPLDPTTDRLQSVLHFGFATTFFIAIAIMTLALFPRDHALPRDSYQAFAHVMRTLGPNLLGRALGEAKKRKDPGRQRRALVYVLCGWIILVGLALCVLLIFVDWNPVWCGPTSPFYWAESVGVLAFGIAWLVKAYRVFGGNKSGPPHRFPRDRTHLRRLPLRLPASGVGE